MIIQQNFYGITFKDYKQTFMKENFYNCILKEELLNNAVFNKEISFLINTHYETKHETMNKELQNFIKEDIQQNFKGLKWYNINFNYFISNIDKQKNIVLMKNLNDLIDGQRNFYKDTKTYNFNYLNKSCETDLK